MDFNFDTGAIFGGLQSLDVTTLPPLGGQTGVLSIIGSGAVGLPKGTTLEQPASPDTGMFRFNSDTTLLEYYNGTTWNPLSTSSSTVSSVAANSNSSGLTITGSPITSAGTFQFTLDAGLQALSTLSGTGVLVSTGTNTWASRTITGTAGDIVVTNGDGISANPTIDLATITQATSGNFVKVTLDGFGRVTGNESVTASDITPLVDGTYVNISGDTMASGANLTFVGGGEVLGLPATPSSDTSAVSKAYVDAVAAGLSWKQAVQAASTANINLTIGGLLTLDGYTTVAGDRVLVKNQTNLTENGIYVVAAGAWTRAADMDATTPINEVNGAAAFVENGTLYSDTGWTQINQVNVIGTDPIVWSQFSGAGSYTAGTGLTLSGNVFSLSTPVAISAGGTGTTATPGNGTILVGNGTGYTQSTITAGTAISVVNAAGSITIANTGVTSLAGTSNEINVSSATGAVTLSLSNTLVVPGSINIPGLTANGVVYVSGTGSLTSVALTDGEILIGSTGSTPVATSITAGTGVSVTNAAGSITIDNTGVTSVNVSGGTTGLSFVGGPITTTGTITMSGTLAPANGGSGLTALGSANQLLGVNASGTAAEYKTITAGTGIGILNGANVITLSNTGVTSVGLTAPSIFTVTGSPVTTTGTLDFALNTQLANSVLAGPTTGSPAVPAFRSLEYADLPLQLYVEKPSTPTAPVATGNNAVAIGSGSVASSVGSFAEGDGANARLFGQKAYANGSFATAGDAQHGLYVLRNETSNATYTELFLDGVSERLVLPFNSLFVFDIFVGGRRTDAVGGGAGYRFVGVARKDTTNGSITFVGTPSKTIVGETNTPWDARVTADTVNGSIMIEVRGEAAKTIRWVSTTTTTEITN